MIVFSIIIYKDPYIWVESVSMLCIVGMAASAWLSVTEVYAASIAKFQY